jgi:hypothetical protein
MSTTLQIGTGGDYTDWGSVINYLTSLTVVEDDYDLVQISDINNDTACISRSLYLNQHTLRLLNPSKYNTTSTVAIILNNATLYYNPVNKTKGYVEMSNLKIKAADDASNFDGLLILYSGGWVGNATTAQIWKLDNLLLNANGKLNACLRLYRLNSSMWKITNLRAHTGNKYGAKGIEFFGDSTGPYYPASDVRITIMENCTIFSPVGFGVEFGIYGTFSYQAFWSTFKNVVICGDDNIIVDNKENWHLPSVNYPEYYTIKNCADSDNSLTIGDNNVHGITNSDFTSIDPTSSTYGEIGTNSSLYQLGTTDISAWNTTDYKGNSRPNSLGTVSIGAHEPLNTVTDRRKTLKKNINPILSNQRVTSYRLDSHDSIQARIVLNNKSNLSALSNVSGEFYLNNTGSFVKCADFWTDRRGVANISYSCADIKNINSCAGYVKVTVDSQTYTSNLVRFNFTTMTDITV